MPKILGIPIYMDLPNIGYKWCQELILVYGKDR